jgi:hypothetical protein
MKGKERGGSNPPFSASNFLDLEPQYGRLLREFLLIVQFLVRIRLDEASWEPDSPVWGSFIGPSKASDLLLKKCLSALLHARSQ